MNKKQCGKVATHRFTWPGNDETFICKNHLFWVKQIVNAMGMYLQIIPLGTDIQKTCTQKVKEQT